MADFIGVSGCGEEVGGWVAAEEGLAGDNSSSVIGAIVRAIVARLPGALAGDALPLWCKPVCFEPLFRLHHTRDGSLVRCSCRVLNE